MVVHKYNSGRFSLWGAPNVLHYAFKKAGVKATRHGITETLAATPSYPNVESVENLLDAYHCPSLLVETNLDDLQSEDINAILYMKTKWQDRDQYYYGFLIHLDADHIEYYISGQRIKETRAVFLEKWTSCVLLFHQTPQSVEKDLWINKVIERGRLVCFLSLLFISSAHFYFNFSGRYSQLITLLLLTSLNIIGLYLSFQLYKAEKGLIFNGTTQSKCSVYKGFDCEKVFRSSWGKILNFWSLAELGLFYFIANSIFLLLKLVTASSSLALLSVITISVIPIIFYSLLTQWLVIKSWCSNCLGVQLSLGCAGVIGFLNIDSISKVILAETQWYIFIVLTLALSWAAAKKAIYKVAKYKEVFTELGTIKKDAGLFVSRLNAGPKLTTREPANLTLDINEWQASKFTIVISPFCEYCRDLVYDIYAMATVNRLNARISVILNALSGTASASYSAWNAVSNQIAQQPQNTLAILKVWYDCLDIEKFNQHFGFKGSEPDTGLINDHTNFCMTESLKEVPCIYYKGRRIDHLYTLKELSYFLNRSI